MVWLEESRIIVPVSRSSSILLIMHEERFQVFGAGMLPKQGDLKS